MSRIKCIPDNLPCELSDEALICICDNLAYFEREIHDMIMYLSRNAPVTFNHLRKRLIYVEHELNNLKLILKHNYHYEYTADYLFQ